MSSLLHQDQDIPRRFWRPSPSLATTTLPRLVEGDPRQLNADVKRHQNLSVAWQSRLVGQTDAIELQVAGEDVGSVRTRAQHLQRDDAWSVGLVAVGYVDGEEGPVGDGWAFRSREGKGKSE